MQKKLLITISVILDLLAALLVWTLFFCYRKVFIEEMPIIFSNKFYIGIIAIPLFWLFLYIISDSYKNILRKSRLKELSHTFSVTFIGTIILFFVALLDDYIDNYQTYYSLFLILFLLHLIITAFFRLIITSFIARKVHNGSLRFNTIIIGDNQKSIELYHELMQQKPTSGYHFLGFVSLDEKPSYLLSNFIPNLGQLSEIKTLIKDREIEDIIIAIESSEHHKIEKIIEILEGENVFIKMIPDMYDIVLGKVKTSTIFGTALIEVKTDLIPTWHWAIKRTFDLSVALFALIILSPIYIFAAIMVKLSSSGSIFFTQERIGYRGKKFKIIKFRSMYEDAEKNGPQLSQKNDQRITPWGTIMRKFRLDELPQFYNVLIGEMSIVGPRPERAYYIDLISKKAPHYRHLHKVRPGITSWGMVKFGYAENVEEMIQRMRYDMLYIENISFFLDLKILIYTIIIVLQGRGK